MAKRPVATVLTVMPSAATSRGEGLEEADRGHPVRVGEVEAGDRLAGGAGADVDDPSPAPLPHSRDDGVGEHLRRQDQGAVGRLPLLELVVEGAAERRARRCWRRGCRSGRAPRRPRPAAPRGDRGRRRRRRRASPRGSIAAAASSIRSRERLAIATRQPSRASAAAIARPIPRLAPITSAVRPSSPRSMPSACLNDLAMRPFGRP